MNITYLLLFIGSSLAFAPGKEYKYQYEGGLKMGLPEIRNKFASTGMKATLHIQFQSADKAVFKLSDIQTGELVGDSPTEDVRIVYSPIPAMAASLEEPFVVFLNKEQDVMMVPDTDVEWTVNIRKSIAHFFVTNSITKNVNLDTRDEIQKSFTVTESSVFGRCSSDYNVGQTGSDSYTVTRSINFDKCDEAVSFMHTSLTPLTGLSKSQLGNVMSRSSVTTRKMTGKLGHLVVQGGKVEGYIGVNPFAVPSDKLMSFSSQTFTLASVNRIAKAFIVPRGTRIVKTWNMEVASDFSAPENPLPYINYYGKKGATDAPFALSNAVLGIPITSKDTKDSAALLKKMVSEVSGYMLSVGAVPTAEGDPVSIENKITRLLDACFYMVRTIDTAGLERLFNEFSSDNSKLGQMKLSMFIDVLASSDVMAPMKVLLGQMQKNKISPEKITSIFVTFATNFAGTPILSDVLAYAQTLDMNKNPIMTTNVWINVASAISKACNTKEVTPYQIYGKEGCDINAVESDFLPFLKKKFENYHESYKRCAVVWAMSNLGTHKAYEFLETVVKGDYDVRVREIAILAFDHPKVLNIIKRERVFELMLPIIENTQEDPLLRQSAIASLFVYDPCVSLWYRLAKSTWTEPSKSVASFIYQTIKEQSRNTMPMFKKLNSIFHFLLPLTKPAPPSSPFNVYNAKYIPEKFSSMFLLAHTLKDDSSNMNRGIYALLMGDFGGVTTSVLEGAFSTSLVPTIMDSTNSNIEGEVIDFFSKFMNPTNSMDTGTHRESNIYLRLLEKSQFILPLNSKTLPHVNTKEGMDFYISLFEGKKIHHSKFINPATVELLLPTEIGLPFIGRFSTPTAISAEGTIKLAFEATTITTTFDFHPAFKFASRVLTKFSTVVPWSQNFLSSGVATAKNINFPGKITVKFGTGAGYGGINFDLAPSYDKEFAFIDVENIPYVASSLYPGKFEKYELVTVRGKENYIYQDVRSLDKERYGLNGRQEYIGDVPYTSSVTTFRDNLHHPERFLDQIMSPTSRYSCLLVALNFGNSETKSVNVDVAYNPTSDTFVFNYEVLLKGVQNRFFKANYENKVVSRDAFSQKSQISYHYLEKIADAKPEAYCVEIETNEPKITDTNTFMNQLNSVNMAYHFKGRVTGGTTCKDRELATIKGSFTMSDSKRNSIQTDENITFRTTMDDLDNNSLFDKVSAHVHYKEPLPSILENVGQQTYNAVRNSKFADVSSNYLNVKNSKGKITVEGDRLPDGAWTLEAKLPKENMKIDYFKVPLTAVVPFFFA